MKIPQIQNLISNTTHSNPAGNKPRHPFNPSFGILKGYRETAYGQYMWGTYKGNKIEVFNAEKHKQKLIYVSDNLLNWVKSKLIYFQNGEKKINRSSAKK